jgi:hypothetical protein
MSKKQARGSALFHEMLAWSIENENDRGELMRSVWSGTPWIVNAYTGPIQNHGAYRAIMEWCLKEFGKEASPIHGIEGQWRAGGATVVGWTWMGFATEEMMERFKSKWKVRDRE